MDYKNSDIEFFFVLSGQNARPEGGRAMEAQQIPSQEIIHMALVTGQYEGDPEAEELLHSLQKEGGDAVDVRLIFCRRLEEAESELRRQKTEIIHFCGSFDESGDFLIQKKSGQILAGKTGNQIMDLIARLPYQVKVVGYPGYMTLQRARRAKKNTVFLAAMGEAGVNNKEILPFFAVLYPSLFNGDSLGKAYDKASAAVGKEHKKPGLFAAHIISQYLFFIRSGTDRIPEDKEFRESHFEETSDNSEQKESRPAIPSPKNNIKQEPVLPVRTGGVPAKQIRQMEEQLDLVPFLVRAVAGNNLAYQKFLRGEKERPVSEPVTLPEDVKEAYQRYYEETEPMEERKCLQIEPLALSFWHKEAKDHQAARMRIRDILRAGWPELYAFIDSHRSPVYFGVRDMQFLVGETRVGTPGEIEKIKKSSEGRKLEASEESLRILENQKESLKKLPGKAKDTILLIRNTPEQFSVARAILYAQGKQMDERSFDLNMHLPGCIGERDMMNNAGHDIVLTPEQQKKADILWDAACRPFGGVPVSMEAAKNSFDVGKMRPWTFSLHWRGFPGKTLYETICDPKVLREMLDVLAICMKDGEPVTEAKKQEAVYLLLRNLCLLSMGQIYQKMREELKRQWKSGEKTRQELETLKKQIREKKKEKKKNLPDTGEMKQLRRELEQMKQGYEKQKEQDRNTIDRLRGELNKQSEETRQIQQSFDSTLDEIQEGVEADKRMAEEEEQGQTMDLTEEEQALLAGRRVVVLGGLPKWQTRLRQQYPNVTCIPPENLHFDKAMIRDADTVVVAIKYIGHSMGERAMIRYLAQYGVQTVYFYGSNEERLLRRIYETLSV
jgi:hypothetical protein